MENEIRKRLLNKAEVIARDAIRQMSEILNQLGYLTDGAMCYRFDARVGGVVGDSAQYNIDEIEKQENEGGTHDWRTIIDRYNSAVTDDGWEAQ